MKALIVYCHPSEDSFTRHVRDAFIQGITDAGHEYILSDLYAMDFKTDMSEKEYLRDANYRDTNDLAEDVLAEQDKVNAADAIVLIYPVFWTEAPAKLVGWFDRVWSYGFAYGKKRMKTLDKGLVLCTAGNTRERLEQFGLLESMNRVMFGDRLFKRVRKQEFTVFAGMTRECELREKDWDRNLETAYEKGRTLFDPAAEVFSLEGRFFTAVENSPTGGSVRGDRFRLPPEGQCDLGGILRRKRGERFPGGNDGRKARSALYLPAYQQRGRNKVRRLRFRTAGGKRQAAVL